MLVQREHIAAVRYNIKSELTDLYQLQPFHMVRNKCRIRDKISPLPTGRFALPYQLQPFHMVRNKCRIRDKISPLPTGRFALPSIPKNDDDDVASQSSGCGSNTEL
ncbi:hypothetical protein QE152_g8077 [Popillia japonica]|uniref:Uncharacterized protein n=1 Tax=Popillia japonica TaxID=7064 RepID=A0AAW1MD06_POPJA